MNDTAITASTAALNDNTGKNIEEESSSQTNVTADSDDKTTGNTGSDNSIDSTVAGMNETMLQSAAIDLDGDGINEQIEAVQLTKPAEEAGTAAELEGILKVKSESDEKNITFVKKYEGLSGLLTSMEFEDLDGDGAKDVFIIVPENGASFSISNYFIYSYKKNKSFSFTSDVSLADFLSGFIFKKAGGNKLSIINNSYAFEANLNIESYSDQILTEEDMADYEQSAWIDPVSVDISDSSRLALVKNVKGTPEIKVPLPVFGLATVDMIGELDLYYSIDSDFKPVLKRFEVMDLNGNEVKKAGSCELQ